MTSDRHVIADVDGDNDAEELWQSLGTLTARSIDDIMRSTKPTVTLRAGVWAILTDLLTDPDPTPVYEEENPSDEPWNRALNSVRGSAMLSLFEYLRWIYRASGGDQQRPDVAVLAPEAIAMLEAHLRPEVESGPTIRSVYGQSYVSIYAMSKSWTIPATPRIFGPPVVAGDAAWTTYLALNNVYDDLFKLLRLRYYETVVNLPIADYNEAVSRGLGAHVIRAYARGLTTFDEPQSIVGAFADYASPALLGKAIHAAGNSLQAADISRDIWERMEQLYDRLLDERAGLSGKDALEAFGSFGLWVIAPTSDSVWTLEALRRTLELTRGQLHFRTRVLAWLADLSVGNPYGAASALLAMTAEGGPLRYSLDPTFRTILKNAVDAGGEALKVATAVDERLTRIGIHNYHDLFRREPST